MQTSEVSEDPSCSSNSESGNDLGCQHSNAVTIFQTPFLSESYLDSEDSAYGNVHLSLPLSLIWQFLLSTLYLIRNCIRLSENLEAFY